MSSGTTLATTDQRAVASEVAFGAKSTQIWLENEKVFYLPNVYFLSNRLEYCCISTNYRAQLLVNEFFIKSTAKSE